MRTIYHDSDGWPRPVRGPQHAAAPFRQSSPVRARAHRALRLFGTAGLWAAGLCLVIGSIVLVVSQATPGKLAPVSVTTKTRAGTGRPTRAGPRPGRTVTPPARPAPRHTPAIRPGSARTERVLAAFAGRGDATTAAFRTAAAGGWQIRWSYACPAAVPAGLFVVEDAGPGAIRASITQSGVAGHGITSLGAGAGAHRLIVISTCSWTMKVTQQR
jgi:hypothetical protein